MSGKRGTSQRRDPTRQGLRVVVSLVVLGMVCVALRLHFRRDVEMAQGDSTWRISYSIGFHAERPGARMRVAFPADTRHSRVFRQELFYSGLTADRSRPPQSETREVALVAERAGPMHLGAQFDVQISPRANWRPVPAAGELTVEARAEALRSTKTIQADSKAVLDLLQQVRGSTAQEGDLVGRLFKYCAEEIAPGEDDAPADAAGAIERKTAAPGGRARALVALCRAAKVPARIVSGFELREEVNMRPRLWAEVFDAAQWVPYDPDGGFARELPARFVPVRRGTEDIARGTGVVALEETFSVIPIPPPPGIVPPGRHHPIEILDLTRLPLEMHQALEIILLMPLGALVTAIFRTIIGIRTYGTFTPTLLALSFVYADWRTGLVVFAVVMLLGLTSRKMLDWLKLLMVPRLSVILTLVVLCIIFSVSVLDYYHLTPSVQAVLLPMVILTMTIERFYVTSEEDSFRFALQLMAGTVIVGFCCYLVLRWETVGHVLLTHPELHLFTVAALVLLGRYTGYRLSELLRFRDLGSPRRP